MPFRGGALGPTAGRRALPQAPPPTGPAPGAERTVLPAPPSCPLPAPVRARRSILGDGRRAAR